MSGTVVERNEELDDTPELVNDSAYGDGWMIKIELSDPSQLDGLMSASDYEQFLATQ